MTRIRSDAYLKELNTEYRASRRCLENIPEHLFEYKPHTRSMNMGYLALLVAEIPLWIKHMIVEGEIDFATFKHSDPKNTNEMVQHLDENMEAARQALQNVTDEALQVLFALKANGQILYQAPKIDDIGLTLNHWSTIADNSPSTCVSMIFPCHPSMVRQRMNEPFDTIHG